VSAREPVDSLLDVGSIDPRPHRVCAKLYEDALAAVFDGGKPGRLDRDLRPFDVALILAVDVGHRGFQAREARQRKHFTQAVKLDDRLDAVRPP